MTRLEPGELIARALPDGRRGAIVPLTFGRARLYVEGPDTIGGYDDGW